MLILALESSAKAASAALCRDGELIAQSFQRSGLTGVGEDTVVCPVMDARRSQVYNALFEFREGRPVRLCPDRAIFAGELSRELAGMARPVWVLGDGWRIADEALSALGTEHVVAPELIRYQNAFGVALAAMDKTPSGAEELLPVYLRLSQAERERQERMQIN